MDLRPGEGLGLHTLGTTLWDTLNLLRGPARVADPTTQTQVTWADQNPHSSYIVITRYAGPNVAYRLVFSGISQRLELIEALEPAIASNVTWKGQSLVDTSQSDSSSAIDPQRMLNRQFGPTYPPSPHPTFSHELVQAYPGVVFSFSKPGHSVPIQSGNAPQSNKPCPLARLVVSRHDPSAAHATAYPDIGKLERMSERYPVAEGDIAFVDVQLADASASSTRTKITLNIVNIPGGHVIEPVHIVLGQTTAEDITCSLGPPLRTHYKEDTRLAIHDPKQTSSASKSSSDYFSNYFSLGLDFLLDGDTNKVSKVLIHANTPGEVLFGRYNKCRWHLTKAASTSGSVASEESLGDIQSYLSGTESPSQSKSTPSSRSDKTMLLDRLADSTDGVKLDRPTQLVAYPGCILEITKNSCIETIWLV